MPNHVAALPAYSVFIIPADKDHAVYVTWPKPGALDDETEVVVCGEPDRLQLSEFEDEEIEVYHEGPKG